MKLELEKAACFFDFHRGWGLAHEVPGPGEWIKWKENQVAVGSDCPYLGHGDGRSLEDCHRSCYQSSCNLVNFLSSADGSHDCVLRRCDDPAQPALTAGADGWQVWSMVNQTQRQCSPYHAIFQQLGQRHRNRPFNHGCLSQYGSIVLRGKDHQTYGQIYWLFIGFTCKGPFGSERL